MIKFHDPISRILAFATNKWPALRVEIQFLSGDHFLFQENAEEDKCALGVTSFPPDGEEGPVVISISADLDRGMRGTLDILAHEIAHAVAGPGDEHQEGGVWDQAYEAIFEACVETPSVERVFTAHEVRFPL